MMTKQVVFVDIIVLSSGAMIILGGYGLGNSNIPYLY
jgi:hypothetical protein